MASTHTTLDAAAVDRKARLAKLASLKRKQPPNDTGSDLKPPNAGEQTEVVSNTDIFLSGRNYDVETKGPKLGFETLPSANTTTVEQEAERVAASTAEQAAKDEAEVERGIDLFKLQPKKPNWDLKRDLAEKMRAVDVKTQNAIARLVRERIENAKKEAASKGRQAGAGEDTQGEDVGIDGNVLVEGVHQKEREEQEEERRERELEAEETVP